MPGFQCGNRGAGGGLGHAQCLCGPRHMFAFGDTYKDAQLFKGHGDLLSPSIPQPDQSLQRIDYIIPIVF
jgi:hypothetical protein